jgi:hypothetical protein
VDSDLDFSGAFQQISAGTLLTVRRKIDMATVSLRLTRDDIRPAFAMMIGEATAMRPRKHRAGMISSGDMKILSFPLALNC